MALGESDVTKPVQAFCAADHKKADLPDDGAGPQAPSDILVNVLPGAGLRGKPRISAIVSSFN